MTRSLRNVLTALVLCGLCLSVRGASAEPYDALYQTVTPFLYPPYPGSASQESIFDHSTPNYTFDNRIVDYSGDIARKNCPSPAPPGIPPPRAGVCNAGQGGYWSYSLGGWVYYDGHDGVDYGISYRPVYAAADANQIVYAGWWDPQNHKVNLGIYVRLRHPNGYNTYYGHMSSISVQACPTVGCTFVPHGEMLGISGTTGNSTGPHLHLLVRSPAGRSVDPYGWKGSGQDPWTHNQPESLWVTYPSLEYYGAKIYPTGPELAFPPAPSFGIIVDDGGPGFFQSPVDCWNDIALGGAQGGIMRYSRARTSSPTCIARWSLPAGANDGFYSVFVRIPPDRATTEGAVYTIRHAGEVDTVIVNQAVFPNFYYVRDGWLYIGKYNFRGGGEEYIELTNRTQDETAAASGRFVGVDAVRFVYQGDTTPTPMTPVTVTATRTPSITPTPTITRTPTLSPTPPLTRTPTRTRTPTVTPAPSHTRTPSRTPTTTRTPTPTRTRVPTATPVYSLIDVYFASRVRYEQNAPPIERAGQRWVRSNIQPQSALTEFFKGPGATERFSFGWIAVYNGFTGYDRLEIRDGVAHVYLTGSCVSEGRDFNIADLLSLTLKQFPEIQFVKIYDQNGQTQNPNGQSDSEPVCMSQFFTPTVTPTRTPTPTRTSTPTRTPTNTRLPSATPRFTRVSVYFVSRNRLANNLPPFEVAGVRWAPTNNIIGTVLDEYFKGPGSTERFSLGWIAIYNGFTGYSKIEIANGIARLYLTGTCEPSGSTYDIADILSYNLKQFPEIDYVKIYDQNGITRDPFGVSDSVPACLEP